jgi:hypothetical protein
LIQIYSIIGAKSDNSRKTKNLSASAVETQREKTKRGETGLRHTSLKLRMAGHPQLPEKCYPVLNQAKITIKIGFLDPRIGEGGAIRKKY